MNEILLLCGVVMVVCILIHRFTHILGVPSLLVFLLLGMLFGVDGIFNIAYDNYRISEVLCSASLIFIMFYGGFGTNIKTAKPVVAKSILLSTGGVILTAVVVGSFVHIVLHIGWIESMLIGSVMSSTDAASVFSILRSKKLNLKDGTASMLELESGSNDPVSYMLTLLFLSMLSNNAISVPILLLKQIVIGVLCGFLIARLTVWILNRFTFYVAQGNTIFLFACAILAYAIPSVLGGNGYLSVYLCGIVLGNSYLPKKRDLVLFFDVLTGVAQILIFFLLGLLVTPSELPVVFFPSLCIMLCLTFLARPLAISAVLLPFRSSASQIGLVCWAGLRGAASIVFAIQAMLSGISMEYNLFNLVFCVVLLSILLQGTLLPVVARRLHMIDDTIDVRKTFTDYQEESDITFIKISMTKDHHWVNHALKDIVTPKELLIVLILRNGTSLIPNGNTTILSGDLLVLSGQAFQDRENMTLYEIVIDKNHKWNCKKLKDLSLPPNMLIVMIRHQKRTIIPDGNTTIAENDTLVIAKF